MYMASLVDMVDIYVSDKKYDYKYNLGMWRAPFLFIFPQPLLNFSPPLHQTERKYGTAKFKLS